MLRRSPGRLSGHVPFVAFAAATFTTAAFTVTAPARAQDVADSTTTPAAEPVAAIAPVASVGPTLAGARVGATRTASATDVARSAAPVSGPRAGRPVALLVVGGTALILGAIIGGSGGTAVAIGGAVVGLVGLYQFIR